MLCILFFPKVIYKFMEWLLHVELTFMAQMSGISKIKWRKSSYDLMQERSVQFIIFY